ncbi:tetratricopeptide repeat protein [Geobacter pickeringii]|uniref:Tetratricopeptide repeat-like domain-containing protein n=1 Tax=Geobacter pickeringii TaxID=345632 RepID=A0A0B5BCS1_9BACT|nr:hypothetical protein [Geobacter pickeringii]AJE02335.1 hypothetical protein GPICK_02145 [Geobacter pickeringii]
MIERTKTIIANAAVIAVISLVLIGANTWWRQRTQFQRGEAFLAKRDYLAAVAGYEASIHMYTPGSPTVEAAAQRLWEIGELMERAGDIDRALISFRALRSSFYAAKWLLQPGEKWIARCDLKIAGLLQRQGYATAPAR